MIDWGDELKPRPHSGRVGIDEILKDARRGDRRAVQGHLRRDPSLLRAMSGGHNRTFLWEATRGNHPGLVKYLLKAGAPVVSPPRLPPRHAKGRVVVVDTKDHWDAVYGSKRDEEVSWTESDPRTSLSLIGELAPPPARVIDVGGGTSRLAGRLLDGGYTVAVLDVSGAALARARDALGDRSARVRWIVADVTAQPPPELGMFDMWHDRAVFHFLTEAADRSAYAALAARTVPPGGHAMIATFALDGPEKCSGLPVCRYDGARLAAEMGEPFALIRSVPVVHVTPWGRPQSFQYAVLRRA